MSEIRCRAMKDGVQCAVTHSTTEAVAPGASFICKDHPRAEQVRANGRKYDPRRDEADMLVHFQDTQFDPDLGGIIQTISEDGVEHGRRVKPVPNPGL